MTILRHLILFLVVCQLALWWQTFLRGPFRFVYNPVVALLVRLLGADGMTVGARCYTASPDLIAEFPDGFEPVTLPYDSPARKWWRHEKQHNHQYRVRPFMGPVYVFWELVVGYKRNPLEHESDREER